MIQKIRGFVGRHLLLNGCLQMLLALATIVGSCFLLQYSTKFSYNLDKVLFFFFSDQYGVLNLMTIGVVLAVFWMLSNRLWLACLLCALISGVMSVINYYVIQFHTMPLSFLVLRNFQTAMNVVFSYSFQIDGVVKRLLLGTAALVCMCLIYRMLFVPNCPAKGFPWVRNAILTVWVLGVVVVGYAGPDPIKPDKVLGWSWEESYGKYGYVVCTVESFSQLYHGASMPEGYSQELADELCAAIPGTEPGQQETPDIILILNETFYDLSQITDPETDVPYLANIDAMDNLLRGYAVVPRSGGGTNNSEYELLTSNSLQLMPGITPFNTLKMQGANSIVSHLNALGYHTLGTHSEPALNYSRGVAYPALGFQHVYFEEAYQDVHYYQNRGFETDESVYQNLIRWYEEMPDLTPRFQYLLTIQNHGDWQQNDSADDLVHTGRDYGDNTQAVNEFLTCLYMSDAAFGKLTEYYAAVDRPVIVCMLGDHSPTFAAEIADQGYSKEELNLRLRTVPLLIWANYPLEEQELGTMSMNMVIPTLLEIANVESTPYYRYLLDVKETMPVLTSIDVCYDRNGTCYSYQSEDMPFRDLVNGYFCLEYQNIETEHNRDFYQPDSVAHRRAAGQS